MKIDPRLTARARELRRYLTLAERILRKALRARRFVSFKFRRQQVFGAYLIDFYCANAQLAIELDGETHLERSPEDEQRTQWLQHQGVKVLRFWNNQIYDDLEAVLELLFRECEARRDMGAHSLIEKDQ